MGLEGGLHGKVLARRQLIGAHPGPTLGVSAAVLAAVEGVGIILHLFNAVRPCPAANPALKSEIEHWLDAARDIPGEQRNGASRCDRGQTAVAKAMAFDLAPHVRAEGHHIGAGEERACVIHRELALFGGEPGACEVSGVLDRRHPFTGMRERGFRPVAVAKQNQSIRQSGDAKPDAALRLGLGLLAGQRVIRHIDDVVEQAHGNRDRRSQPAGIEAGIGGKRRGHKAGEVDRPQQAGAIGRQGLFAAWIGGVDLLAIGEIIQRVDPVDEDDAWFGGAIVRLGYEGPQPTGVNGFVNLAAECEVPAPTGLDGCHERIADQHREIEIAQPMRVRFRGDEFLDIGVVAAQRRHHRAAALTGRHNGAAHTVPYVHEADRSRSLGTHALHNRAARSQRREIVTDAATSLHGESGLLDGFENGAEVVLDAAKYETVEERYVAPRARAG